MSGGEKEGERKRPNAGYRLSKTREDLRPDEIVYHYDRERRLEKAPKAVRDLYCAEDPPRRSGLIRAGGRAQLFTMIAILLVSILALAATLLGRDADARDIGGNRVTIQAIRYDGMIIMALAKTAPSARQFLSLRRVRRPHVGPVAIEVFPIQPPEIAAMGLPPQPSFYHSAVFTEESPEFFRFALPFDAEELGLAFRADGWEALARVRVE